MAQPRLTATEQRHALWFVALLAGCNCASRPVAAPACDTEREAVSSAYLRAVNDQGLIVFEQLATDRNTVYSPVSASMALSLLAAGARGDTLHELRRALGETADAAHDASRVAHALLCDWLEGGRTVRVANAVFVDERAGVSPEFERSVRRDLGASVLALNFAEDREGSAHAIADWFDAALESDVRPATSESTRLVIVSGVRFTAAWAQPFAEHRTTSSSFTLANGQVVSAPTMHLEAELPIFETGNLIGVELPYEGDRFALTLVRARDSTPVDNNVLSAEQLELSLSELAPASVELALPRFRIEARDQDLVQPLRPLGIQTAFDRQRADFTGMVSERRGAHDLFVERVVQDVVFEVDERGTRAAATTTATVVAAAAPESRPRHIRFDRPFFFVLRDRETGVFLFVGVVRDPRERRSHAT